eukprot:8267279-Pyramimonas_sp.AAC.1
MEWEDMDLSSRPEVPNMRRRRWSNRIVGGPTESSVVKPNAEPAAARKISMDSAKVKEPVRKSAWSKLAC